MSAVLCETDWLATEPVFYNERTRVASHSMDDVVDAAGAAFDPEGFNNYLRFGYSVFGRTPVRDVKVLPPSSRLVRRDDGGLAVERLDDPAEALLGARSDEKDVLDLLEDRIRTWERSQEGDIVLPTSGGYDSRLLNALVGDRGRIRSFTYGVSERQGDSYEAVYAGALAEALGTRWELVPLGDYHRDLDEWDSLFGASVHAHGMYHIEFYRKIRERLGAAGALLSGIVGDAWAGSVEVAEPRTPDELESLGYIHGLAADAEQSLLSGGDEARQAYWQEHAGRLGDAVFRVVCVIRLKMILLCYLLRVPRHLGFAPWSPFLDPAVALGMLNLAPERRRDRAWQRDFFARRGLDLENRGLRVDLTNVQDLQALRRVPLPPLDADRLGEVVRPAYVGWINRTVDRAARVGLLGRLMIRARTSRLGVALGWRPAPEDEALKAYVAYMVLRPVENLVRRREAAR